MVRDFLGITSVQHQIRDIRAELREIRDKLGDGMPNNEPNPGPVNPGPGDPVPGPTVPEPDQPEGR